MIPWHISSISFLHLNFDLFGHVLLNKVSTELHWFQIETWSRGCLGIIGFAEALCSSKVEAGNCSPRMCGVYCLSNCHDRSLYLLHWVHFMFSKTLPFTVFLHVYRLYSMYSVYILYKHILVYWSDYSLDYTCGSHWEFGWLSQED